MTNKNKINRFLLKHGIKDSKINYGLNSDELNEICIKKGLGIYADSGALVVNTGEFTGRSPKDRFIVEDKITKNKIWWGDINSPFDSNNFDSDSGILILSEF